MDQELWRLALLGSGKYAVQLQSSAGAWQTLNEFDTLGDAEHSFESMARQELDEVVTVIRQRAVPRCAVRNG